MFISIYTTSKNKISLRHFFEFFIKICKNKKWKLSLFLNHSPRKSTQNIFTILKSPHVNKTAQEQFMYQVFSKQINVQSFQLLKFLIVLKQIQIKVFSDIQIQIKYAVQFLFFKLIRIQILNPKNYKINLFKNSPFQYTNSYLRLLDSFGNQLLKL